MNKREIKRQHPIWIINKIGLSIKEVIIPVIIFFIFNLRHESLWVKLGSIALILYIIFRIITIIFQWKNHTYLFTNKNIEIEEGRFVAHKRNIALAKIQRIERKTPVFHRLLGLTSLTLITGASSDKATIHFEMISNEEANRISQMIEDYKKQTPVKEMSSLPKQKLHYKISLREIVFISLTSLYLIAIFPILSSIFIKIDEFFSIEELSLSIFTFLSSSYILIIFVAIFLLILAVCVSIVMTYIRFGNYQVTADNEQIYISKGILNTIDYAIPREKINGILIEKTFLRGIFNIVKVKVLSMGNVSESDQETDVLFPFISEKKLKKVLPDLLPSYKLMIEMQPLPKQALFINLIQPSYFIVIVTFLVFFFFPEYWGIPVALFFFIVIRRVLKTYRTEYIQKEGWIQFKTGVFSTELFLTKREKIDELKLSQSWLESKLQLASVSIASRAKPVHIASINHLSEEIAVQYYYWYKKGIEKNEKVKLNKPMVE